MADKKSWDERFDAIVGEFPNIENFNWGTAVSGDMDLFDSVDDCAGEYRLPVDEYRDGQHIAILDFMLFVVVALG